MTAGEPDAGVLDIARLAPALWDDPGAMAEAARGTRLNAGVPAPDDPAVLIPTSGTTGRSKLVIQTHRAYAMAGEGFPFWMELTAADRLMTSLPLFHVNAPAYSVMGSLACGAGLVLLERFSASDFLAAARRHGATEFNAIGAMLEILMRQPEQPDDASTPLRLCYTGPAPEQDRQLEMERRLGPAHRRRLRHVGVAVRPDLAARHPPVRHAGRAPPASRAGHGQRGAGGARRCQGPGGRGRRAGGDRGTAAAQPGHHPRLLGHAAGDRPGPRQRLAAHRGPGHGRRRRHLHVRVTDQGSDPPPGREPVPAGGGGDPRQPPGGAGVGGHRRAVGPDRGGGQGVRRGRGGGPAGRRGGQPGLRRAAGVRRRAAGRVQGAPVLAAGGRAAPDPDRPDRQAPAPGRASARRVRRRDRPDRDRTRRLPRRAS